MQCYSRCYILFILTLFTACSTPKQAAQQQSLSFYKEAHRGGRGLMPENTIPAMLNGITASANVCELDTYTSGDGQVIVSHDPFINSQHSYNEQGQEMARETAEKYVLHQMTYAQIKKFDTGSKFYSAFPEQKKLKTHIPLLADLIDSVEAYSLLQHVQPVLYNIELKTSVTNDGSLNDTPQKLADKVMQVVKSKKITDRVHIQSFDIRALQYLHKAYPEVTLSFLVENKNSAADNFTALGFYPPLYSPNYKLVTPQLVTFCHSHHMQVIPWTVNTTEEMQRLIDIGVDGLITDYPNLFSSLNYAKRRL
jgi:glycerophosphoryl diester phosphodiesterase